MPDTTPFEQNFLIRHSADLNKHCIISACIISLGKSDVTNVISCLFNQFKRRCATTNIDHSLTTGSASITTAWLQFIF